MFDFIREEDGGWYFQYYESKELLSKKNLYGIFLGAINGNIEYYGSLLNKYAKYKKCDYDIENIEKKYEKYFELRMRIMDKGFFVNLDLDDDVYGIMHPLISGSKLNSINKNDEYYDHYEPLIKSYNLSYELSSLLNIDYLEEYYNDILVWIDNFKSMSVNKMRKVKKINKKV